MTDRYRLRPYRESDLGILFELRNDPEVQFMLLTHPRPNTTDQVRAWIDRKIASDSILYYTIASVKDDEPVGYIQAADIDPISRTCRIGFAVVSDFQGKGIFREVTPLFDRYLADTLNIRKIIGEVLSVNQYSIKVLEATGYSKVGVFKEHYFNRGVYHDVLLYEKFIQ